MKAISRLYRRRLAMLTDLYELTMAQGYWRLGMAQREAVFHLTFRRPPFGGGYTVACGLEYAAELLEDLHFEREDLDYLRGLKVDGVRLFEDGFLDFLRDLSLAITVDAVPEGTVVFPHEPLVRVMGPMLQAQLVETLLLNTINFQTLIATKAARVCQAAEGQPVVEFGLRRAQGIDGGLTASRAAYVGGCEGTSNVLAGEFFGIPVRGTQAHSWVMAFNNEEESFRSFVQGMPRGTILLVDTYDTVDGVRKAARVAQEICQTAGRVAAVRLDSGDLAYLSVQSRKVLDEAGLHDVKILATGDLDEHVIHSLRTQHAAIDLWGVGTRLVTGHDEGALGGIYKLAALRRDDGTWDYKIKLSERLTKTSDPGVLRVRRFRHDGQFIADAVYDEQLGIGDGCTIVHPSDPLRRKSVAPGTEYEELLVRVFDQGRQAYRSSPLQETRRRCIDQLRRLHPGIKRLLNPHEYPAGLELRLHELKTGLIFSARGERGHLRPQRF